VVALRAGQRHDPWRQAARRHKEHRRARDGHERIHAGQVSGDLAETRWQPGHRRRWRRSTKLAYRLSCLPCQDQDGGSDGRDDGGSLVGEEPVGEEPVGEEPDAVGVGVGVGSVQVGEDSCVGATSEGVGSGDEEELVGVGVGVLVGAATGQVGAFVFV
jgi:hypothetical protein